MLENSSNYDLDDVLIAKLILCDPESYPARWLSSLATVLSDRHENHLKGLSLLIGNVKLRVTLEGMEDDQEEGGAA